VDQARKIIQTKDSSGFSTGTPHQVSVSVRTGNLIRSFSLDICAVVIIANITRCFFYLGHRFETCESSHDKPLASGTDSTSPAALIVQSILLIASQLLLLSLCIHNKPPTPPTQESEEPGTSLARKLLQQRPYNFWKWDRLGTYLEFLAGFIVVMMVIHFALGWSQTVVEA